MNFSKSIFREYDIRGIAGRELSADFAHALGRAYALLLKEVSPKPAEVGVGRDCRLTSDSFAEALISGLRQEGINVVSFGTCPTPLTYFGLHYFDLAGAIMVTGSHNPAEYNGFKICLGKSTLHGEAIQDLRRRIDTLPSGPMGSVGALRNIEIIPHYIDYVQKNIRPGKLFAKKKVVIDAGNGTAATVAPTLFRALGAEVVELYCTLDGAFPNHHPDPTEVKNLKDIQATVRRERADFGVAFDGDADRIGLVDENGGVIFGDEILVILSRAVLKANPGATIISEVKCSYRLYDDIKKHGGRGIMWKTGHSLIKAKMKEENAALAGEMSGHIFFADRFFGFDDAIYAAARVFEIATTTKAPVSEWISDLPKTVSTPEIRIDCSDDKKFALVETVKAELAAKYSVNTIDGVRVEFGDGWALMRASNTQPVLVLRFEAGSQARLDEFKAIMAGVLGLAATRVGHEPISF